MSYTVSPVGVAPVVQASNDLVCVGGEVLLSTTCPSGANVRWSTGAVGNSIKVQSSIATSQSYTARCVYEGGCQSAESLPKSVKWNAFDLTLINIGQSKSGIKVNNRLAWSAHFVSSDAGPSLEQSTETNPSLYYTENINKTAPRYWTAYAESCLGTSGSMTFDMLLKSESGVAQSFNTHENNAPYFMYANREGWTELYAQNHPAYGFYLDNGNGGNVYDAGLPKGLYKLGIRYWDQKGQGSIYPSTRQAAGKVLAYQEYWFRIQSKDGIGVGAARQSMDNSQQTTVNGVFASVAP
ncbi:MAG: hypothetical protein ACK5S6_04830, partial [bacterium]